MPIKCNTLRYYDFSVTLSYIICIECTDVYPHNRFNDLSIISPSLFNSYPFALLRNTCK